MGPSCRQSSNCHLIARAFIFTIAMILTLLVADTAARSVAGYGSPAEIVDVLLPIAGWLLTAHVVVRARRQRSQYPRRRPSGSIGVLSRGALYEPNR